MSLGLLIGTIGALAGVALGSWLSARAQRSLFLETRRQAIRQVQLEACMAYLEAYRKLRSFVLDEAEHVELVRRPDDHGGHPKVQESSQYFELANAAEARLQTLVSRDSPIRAAAESVERTYLQMARARAEYGKGQVPNKFVGAVRSAEADFAQEVYQQFVLNQL